MRFFKVPGLWVRYRPDAAPRSLDYIDWDALAQQGYRGIVVDMDNTLIPWAPRPKATLYAREWLAKMTLLGFSVCILSNGRRARVEPVARTLDTPYIARAKKPNATAFQRAATVLGLPIAQCVAVGDQWATDIVGAKRAGMRAYLVKRMSRREFAGTYINRLIEWCALKIIGVERAHLEKVV